MAYQSWFAALAVASGLFLSGAAHASPSWTTLAFDPEAPATSCANPAICPQWRTFRQANPWPYQAVALAEDGDETIIVLSEPPSGVSREDLKAAVKSLFGDQLIEAAYLRWPMGADGWLEDLVLRVKMGADRRVDVLGGDLQTWKAPAEVVDRLHVLQILQYGTGDGAWFDRIAPRAALAKVQDVRFSVAEFANWMANSPSDWTALDGDGRPAVWRDLLAGRRSGTFLSGDQRFVLLEIEKGADAGDLAASFRRFAVGSDLLLGALHAKDGDLMLVGRARQVPLDVLPPLRFETYWSFAAAPQAEMAQSYERRRIFAGKVTSGRFAGWDWAPILLSSQLQDGEMGALLNIADQILKSWSQAGSVEYYGFIYPEPKEYPFDEVAISDYFAEKYMAQSLRFNWNTKEFATILENEAGEHLSAARTSALPVLYEPSARLGGGAWGGLSSDAMNKDAEAKADEARDAFGEAGDPVLARVVQNVLMFTAVRNFGQNKKGQAVLSRSDRIGERLQVEALAWITKLSRADWADLPPDAQAKVKAYLARNGASPQQLAATVADPQRYFDGLDRRRYGLERQEAQVVALARKSEELDAATHALFLLTCKEISGKIINGLVGQRCEYLSTPETEKKSEALKKKQAVSNAAGVAYVGARKKLDDEGYEYERDYLNANAALALGEILAKAGRNSEGMDGVVDRVMAAGAAIEQPGSIRTPSIVLSKNTVDVEAVGGHSLDFRAQRVKVSASAVKPILQAKDDGVVLMVKADRVNQAEKLLHASTGELPADAAILPPRPAEAVFGDAPQGSVLSILRSAKNEAPPAAAGEAARLLETCNCAAVVRQGPDGAITLMRKGPPVVRKTLLGKSAIVEELARSPRIDDVLFEGFSSEAVSNLASTTKLLRKNAGMSGRRGMFEKIGDAFTPSRDAEPPQILLAKRGDAQEALKIWGDAGVLRSSVNWKTASAEVAPATAWGEAFPAARLEAGDQAFLVRFAATAEGAPRLGVRVSGGGSSGGVLAVLQAWLAKRSGVAAIDQGLVDLRAALVAQLPGKQFEFFFTRHAKNARIAELATPDGEHDGDA